MSDNETTEEAYPPLASSVELYRALRPSWIDQDTGEILETAFQRRNLPQDQKGVSVDLAAAFVLEDYAKTALKNCKGVASIIVGRVREIEDLDVLQDAATHANITGLPHIEEDPKKSEDLAGALKKRATIAWRKPSS